MHLQQPVRSGHQRLVVGGDDGGDPLLLDQRADQIHDPGGGVAVQLTGRLVGEQDARSRGQRPGQGHPLLLAAGQLVGPLIGMAGQADQVQHLGDPGVPLAAARSAVTRSGTSTFSAADSIGSSPNDWNT